MACHHLLRLAYRCQVISPIPLDQQMQKIDKLVLDMVTQIQREGGQPFRQFIQQGFLHRVIGPNLFRADGDIRHLVEGATHFLDHFIPVRNAVACRNIIRVVVT